MKIKIAEPMIVFCDTSLSTTTLLEKGEYEVSQIEKLSEKYFTEFAWYKINTFGYVFAINHEYPDQSVKILP